MTIERPYDEDILRQPVWNPAIASIIAKRHQRTQRVIIARMVQMDMDNLPYPRYDGRSPMTKAEATKGFVLDGPPALHPTLRSHSNQGSSLLNLGNLIAGGVGLIFLLIAVVGVAALGVLFWDWIS